MKTIGAGSMGKVKLAQHNTSKEICAVKIIPRAAKLYQRAHANDPPPQTTQEAAQRHKEFDKEIARDKRTIREGALGRLLFHPFICRLYEMVPMTNHYYMLFEYVEGGQMLDYIVAHGSLKEKHARKFARGIASALDYCHKNNVVHRDLKIENIMINEKGDIKIIDFGLSNLYSPKTLLQTYCGSLYFAAPELLSAKPYTGPEVDVWSFGVVLYVLVCGKVPFDDQSVSVLHEKIKRGNVDYPNFLSRECISLLSRMLVVDPSKRATLYEVCQHPWMNKGYEYKVSNYLPKRVPLTLPLDPEIIKTIAAFDLGLALHIQEELTNVLTSVEYQMSFENWYKITDMGREYASASNTHILPDPTGGFHPLISIYFLVDEMRKRKRAKEEAVKTQLLVQQQQLQEKQLQEKQLQEKQLQEKREQQRQADIAAAAAIVAASSGAPQEIATPRMPAEQDFSHLPTASVNTPNQQFQSSPAPQQLRVAVSVSPAEVQDILFPERAHTTTTPRRSSLSPSKDELSQLPEPSRHVPEQQHLSPRESLSNRETLDPNAGKNAGGINSILRKLSTKKTTKSSQSSPARDSSPPQIDFSSIPPPPVATVALVDSQEKLSPLESYTSKRDPMVRRGVSMKVTAKEKQTNSRLNLNPLANTSNAQQSQHSNSPKLPSSKVPESGSKKNHARSSSTSNNQNKFHGFIPVEYLPPLPNINANTNTIVPSQAGSGVQKAGAISTSGRKLHPTARAKSVGGHTRKDSYNYRQTGNHPPLPNNMAAQNSDELIQTANSSNNDGFFDDVKLDDFDYQDIPRLTEAEIIEQFNNAPPNSMPSIEHCKTLFLKGFFSVQTTSTKPLPVIRYNIINVLCKLGVKFQEVKGGFVCVHTPSVQQPVGDKNDYSANTSTIADSQNDEEDTQHDEDDFNSEERKLYGDAFKSTSSSIDGEQDTATMRTPEPEQVRTPSRQPLLHIQTQTLSPSSNSSRDRRSSTSTGSGGHRRKFSIGNSILGTYRKRNGSQVNMPPNTPATARVGKGLYPDDEDYDYDTGSKERDYDETGDDVSVDSLNGMMIGGGSDMLVSSRIEHRARHQHSASISSASRGKKSPLKFEIHIVKVPLVGLYGVQFKKLLGNTWNYKTLAGQILTELNL